MQKKINKNVAVITDNDGNHDEKIIKKYRDYHDSLHIKIFSDNRNHLNTLEPQFVDANKNNLIELCKALSLDIGKFNTAELLSEKLQTQKTSWALNVFESKITFNYPQYITNAVEWCNER